jgi:hypothetical protein
MYPTELCRERVNCIELAQGTIKRLAASLAVFRFGSDTALLQAGSGKGFFSSQTRSDRLWGPPNPLYSGYRRLSLGTKRPGCEVDHSFHLVPMLRMRGVTHKDNFTLP